MSLRYTYVDGILEKRAPHREGHLAHANSCNELVAGGAHKDAKTDAVTGGLLMFKAADTSVVEKFAKNDPYVVAGLVPSYDIQEWIVAVGEVKPKQ